MQSRCISRRAVIRPGLFCFTEAQESIVGSNSSHRNYAITRHCTLLIEEDISPLTDLRRPEKSHLLVINSSLFKFVPVSEDLLNMAEWYEEGKIHRALADIMVRSKSEVIIANLLFDRDIPFRYEIPLFAPDGTFYLPDFTITWRGRNGTGY